MSSLTPFFNKKGARGTKKGLWRAREEDLFDGNETKKMCSEDDKSLDLLSQLLRNNPKVQLNWGDGLGKKFLESVQYERKEAA